MSDRINGLFIALDKDYREEDVKLTKNAIMQLKGVISVKENVVGIEDFIAEERAKNEIRKKINRLYKLI